MGFTVERRGYFKISDMMPNIIADLMANGFTKVYPTGTAEKDVLLKAGPTVDPLSDTQPWCIRFLWDRDPSTAGTTGSGSIIETSTGGKIDILVAAPEQFPGDKCASYKVRRADGSDTAKTEYVGLVGSMDARTNTAELKQFFDRSRLTSSEFTVFPLCYRLSISDRGFALNVWEQATDVAGNRHSWIVVQRPVDNVTGQVITTGKAPVHCMYGLMAGVVNPADTTQGKYNIRRFIVRESDVLSAYPRVQDGDTTQNPSSGTPMTGADATRNAMDYAAVINPVQQVAITENNKYVITFPNGFNTARFSYTHELDMVAYTSADVVAQGTEVPVQVYGEPTARKYVALNANGPNNTGMRLLMLADGGGVTAAPPGP